MRLLTLSGLIISLGLLVVIPVKAQVIRGEVYSQQSGLPLSGAVVEWMPARDYQVVDERGMFRMTLSAGEQTLRITHVGYDTLLQSLHFNSGQTRDVEFELVEREVALKDLTVRTGHSGGIMDQIRLEAQTMTAGELNRQRGSSLAESLRNQPGISVRSMGPAPARPVVQGLSGQRVTINIDGLPSCDLSATSPDHAVTIDPFQINKVRLIEGPEALLRSSSGTTVLETRSRLIPNSLVQQPLYSGRLQGDSGTDGAGIELMVTQPVSRMLLNMNGSRRRQQDLQTPVGRLLNSGQTSAIFSASLFEFSRSGVRRGLLGEFYHTVYGIPGGFVGGHPGGVTIRMKRNSVSLMSSRSGRLSQNLQLRASQYRHLEIESGDIVGADFLLNGLQARWQAETHSGWRGSAEVGWRRQEMGGFVFTPDTDRRSVTLALNRPHILASGAIEWALRTGYVLYHPKARFEAKFSERQFPLGSAAVSLRWQLKDTQLLSITAAVTSRAPSVEELYSQGPHLAAYSYEVGNPDLPAELGYHLEANHSGSWTRGSWTGALYINEYPRFLTPRNTGEINWQQILPIYQVDALSARFLGADFTTVYQYGALRLQQNVSAIQATNLDEDRPLPEIPPVNGTVRLTWKHCCREWELRARWALDQRRVDQFEDSTAGYVVLDAMFHWELPVKGQHHQLNLRLENLLNREYRDHLSRLRSIMPEPGRRLLLQYQWTLSPGAH